MDDRPVPALSPNAGEAAGERHAGIGAAVAAAAGVAAIASLARAGPIDPPPGPVAPTGKTLGEMEPRTAVGPATTPGDALSLYRITTPGSYYLTGDIEIPQGMQGIWISSSRVHLDLSGFTIRRAGTTALAGILTQGVGVSDVAIRNGAVADTFNGIAIDTATDAVVEDVVLRGIGSTALRAGARARVSRVLCLAPGARGIWVGERSLIRQCIVRGGGNSGILVGSDSVVEECIASTNSGTGIAAADVSVAGCVVRGCIAAGNGDDGIAVGDVVTGCAATDNLGRGIFVTDAVVSGCVARANREAGIHAARSTVRECTSALGFSGTNAAHGFELVSNSVIVDCVANGNQGHGVLAESACHIEGCALSRQSLDGISVVATAGRCRIVNNVCCLNGTAGPNTAGIHIGVSSHNMLEGNHCTFGQGTGVWVAGSANLLTRNSCAGNLTNWHLQVPNNTYGPIVDRMGPSAGMLGNGPAPSTLGTSDLFANFSH